MVDSTRRPSGSSTEAGPSQDATCGTAAPETSNPPPAAPLSDARRVLFRPVRGPQESSIGLRRLRSNTARSAPGVGYDGQPQRDYEQGDDSDDRRSQRSRLTLTPEISNLDVPADQELPACRMPSIPERPQDRESNTGADATRTTTRRSAVQRSLQEEYDPRVVDLLDAIGKYLFSVVHGQPANFCDRSRGIRSIVHHEHPELPVRPLLGKMGQATTNLRSRSDTAPAEGHYPARD